MKSFTSVHCVTRPVTTASVTGTTGNHSDSEPTVVGRCSDITDDTVSDTDSGADDEDPARTNLSWQPYQQAINLMKACARPAFTTVSTNLTGRSSASLSALCKPHAPQTRTQPTGPDTVLQPQETLDLDLQLTPHDGGYTARVLISPAGQAVGAFQSPFAAEDLQNFASVVVPAAQPQPRIVVQATMKEIGGLLFDALFQDELLVCLERSLDAVRNRNATLRIKLRLVEAPELLDLPWEYLYHRRRNLFLSQSTTSSLVHFLDLPEPVASLTVALPLRMLVVIASPTDLPPLDVAREWTNLQSAVHDLVQRGLLTVDRLPAATLPALQQTLRRQDYHIFHFIGHGEFDDAAGQGYIVFTDAGGRATAVPGEILAPLLHNERTLRLALLNACEGARTLGANPFAGIAHLLVQQGVPAVIAMRNAISDEAAIAFSHEFYAALADGYSVDAAVTEGRVAIATQVGNGEWGAPQLIMHARDGALWQVAAAADGAVIDGAAIGADLGVLAQLMQRSAVRDLVTTYRADFAAAEQEIDILSNYKDLHDLLHKLQFRCYNVIAQEARRFPSDELAVDNLLNYEVTLQDIVANLQGVMEEAHFPPNETLWVNELLDAQQLLRRALDTLETESLRRVVWLMRRVLALQPSSINHRLSSAARALRLDKIVASLHAIHSALAQGPNDAPQLQQLASGVQELELLNTQLDRLVTEHDLWQEVQRILGRIDDMLLYDLSELELSWPDLTVRVAHLCQQHQGDWVERFAQDSEQLQKALTEQNPGRIRSYFQRYRQRAGNRFFQVDTQLKVLCAQLRKVGESLSTILKLME
jgi:hypothetical protein